MTEELWGLAVSVLSSNNLNSQEAPTRPVIEKWRFSGEVGNLLSDSVKFPQESVYQNYWNLFIFERVIPTIKSVTFLGHSVILYSLLGQLTRTDIFMGLQGVSKK